MKSFVAVVRRESFASAARALGISRALVSRHIADLEKQVGIRLVNRTTRSVNLTEAGKKYLEFAQRVLTEIAQEDAAMVGLRENAEGELSVVSPKWIGSLDLGDAVAAFAAEHPKIHVRLELGGLSERTYNFIEDGYDIAFHTKHLRDSSIMIKKIAPLQFVLCAAPAYLESHGVPSSPLELANHHTLIHVNDPVWHFTRAGKKVIFKSHRVVFSFQHLSRTAESHDPRHGHRTGAGSIRLPGYPCWLAAATVARIREYRSVPCMWHMRQAGNCCAKSASSWIYCRVVQRTSHVGETGLASAVATMLRLCSWRTVAIASREAFARCMAQLTSAMQRTPAVTVTACNPPTA